jgi:hypothetical protein
VEDHCDAISIVLARAKPGETCNIGGWNEKRNLEIVETICHPLDEVVPHSGPPHRKLLAFVNDRPGLDRRCAMDARKVERELGWRPKETFERWHYMRPSSTSIRIELRLAAFVVFIFFAISCVAQVGELLPFAPTQKDIKAATPAQDVPPCGSTPASSDAGHSSSQSSPQAKTVPHSVTLSWNASVPRSNSKQDAILGYYVYRSRTSKSYNDSNQLNSDPILGTRCIDTTVAPKETYFYVVRAVAGNKKKSDNSNEAKATIPFP